MKSAIHEKDLKCFKLVSPDECIFRDFSSNKCIEFLNFPHTDIEISKESFVDLGSISPT